MATAPVSAADAAAQTDRLLSEIGDTIGRSLHDVTNVVTDFVLAMTKLQKIYYNIDDAFYLSRNDLTYINHLVKLALKHCTALHVTSGYMLHVTLTLYTLVYLIDRHEVDLVHIAREIGVDNVQERIRYEKHVVTLSVLLASDVVHIAMLRQQQQQQQQQQQRHSHNRHRADHVRSMT